MLSGIMKKERESNIDATANGWCQEIKMEEIKKMIDEEKKNHSFWNKLKRLFKGGKNNGKRKS